MIPRKIHLTAKSRDLPGDLQNNIDRLAQIYPDHEIIIHDDQDIWGFIKEHFPKYYEITIKNMPDFIMVVDVVRYMWMSVYGGIYADTDIFVKRRFDFSEKVVFIGRDWTWPEDRSITISVHNCLFASEPGHPIWTVILQGIAEKVRALSRGPRPGKGGHLLDITLSKLGLRRPDMPQVFNVTGPNAISQIISTNYLLDAYPEVKVVPGEAIYQPGMSKGQVDDAFFVHGGSASWVK